MLLKQGDTLPTPTSPTPGSSDYVCGKGPIIGGGKKKVMEGVMESIPSTRRTLGLGSVSK